jgi:hypothetical protein
MSELLIIEPIDLSFGPGAGPRLLGVQRGFGGPNLVTNDPREIWVDSALNVPGQGTIITIDFGIDTEFDTIFLGNTNASNGAALTISYGTNAQNNSLAVYETLNSPLNLPFESQPQPRGQTAYITPQPRIARYVAIHVGQYTGAPLEIGRVIIGKAFRPFYNKERGAQRVPLDSGTRTRLSDGSLSTVSGRLISGFKWVFGDLSEAEVKALWGIIRRRRTTEPVVLIEDADNLSVEGTHYCTLTDLQPLTRIDPRKTRWELSAEDWL